MHQLGVIATGFAANLDQAFRIRRIRCANDEDSLAFGRHRFDCFLPVRGRIADVFFVRADDIGEPLLKCRDDVGCIVHRECRLRHEGKLFRIAHADVCHVFDGFHQKNLAIGQLAHCPDSLGVACMPDHAHLKAAIRVALRFDVDFANQRASRIYIDHLALGCCGRHSLGDAVGGEDDRAIVRAFVKLFDKNSAFVAQTIDHELVVDDFVADKDRRAPLFDRHFNDLDGAVDACTKAARGGEIQSECG